MDKTKKRKLDIPDCKYGALCFRKNPDHLNKFRHPKISLQKSNDANTSSTSTVQKEAADESTQKIIDETLASSSLSSDKTEPENLSQGQDVLQDNDDASNNNASLNSKMTYSSTPQFSETVQSVLNSMPQDFFDFWQFCSSVNESHPEEAFADLGFHLVGTYDLLSQNLPKTKKVLLHCHWRYFYDPPEFQTVIKQDGKDLYHIGYFRDDPTSKPSILASNSAARGPKLTLKGDNIFAAMNSELLDKIKTLKSKEKEIFSKIGEDLTHFADEKKYSLNLSTDKTKARSKKVVSKTFHGLGIVVPVVDDIGYRPLPDSDATVKSILKRIVNAATEDKRLDVEEKLDEIITNVQFANDECDYGMGLELGLDLFCFGDVFFHPHIANLLPLAYELLKRPKYAEIVRFHLQNRKKTDDLDDLR